MGVFFAQKVVKLATQTHILSFGVRPGPHKNVRRVLPRPYSVQFKNKI